MLFVLEAFSYCSNVIREVERRGAFKIDLGLHVDTLKRKLVRKMLCFVEVETFEHLFEMESE